MSHSKLGRDLTGQSIGPCGDGRRYLVVWLSEGTSSSLTREIDSGGYGIVMTAETPGREELVAIKRMGLVSEMGPRELKFSEREVRYNMVLSHPNISAYIEHFYCHNELFLVMEYAEGGTLQNFVVENESLSEEKARSFFQQIVLAVEYAHSLPVFFRDIKLGNILLSEDREKIFLCDLGFSKSTVFDSVCNTLLGTKKYIAPEVHEYSLKSFLIRDVPDYDGKAVDLFAIGVCLFFMIYGSYPTWESPSSTGSAESVEELAKRMTRFHYIIPLCSERGPVSAACRDLIFQLLHPNPEERINMEGILSHPWYKKDLPEGFQEFNQRAAGRNVKEIPARKLDEFPAEQDLLNIGGCLKADECRIENGENAQTGGAAIESGC